MEEGQKTLLPGSVDFDSGVKWGWDRNAEHSTVLLKAENGEGETRTLFILS
jgi:hypothetical protein